MLNPHQVATINAVVNTGNYNNFDMSIIYFLLRNMCPQLVPSSGWGQSIQAHDITIADDIEQLRELRNLMYGHASCASLSNLDYQTFINDIHIICNRFDNYSDVNNQPLYSGKTYSNQLLTVELKCIDATIHPQYVNQLNILHQRELNMDGQIKNLDKKVDQV